MFKIVFGNINILTYIEWYLNKLITPPYKQGLKYPQLYPCKG